MSSADPKVTVLMPAYNAEKYIGEAIASVPDGPPLRFRWRRVLHEVAAVEGPERIAPEWWKNSQSFTRDYFRAEDRDGQAFWLYRDGLYRETAEPRWFMHGLFA